MRDKNRDSIVPTHLCYHNAHALQCAHNFEVERGAFRSCGAGATSVRPNQHFENERRYAHRDTYDHTFGSSADASPRQHLHLRDAANKVIQMQRGVSVLTLRKLLRVMHTYITKNNIPELSNLLDRHPHLVNTPLYDSMTALHIAALGHIPPEHDKKDIVKLLLSTNADVRALTSNLLRPVDLVPSSAPSAPSSSEIATAADDDLRCLLVNGLASEVEMSSPFTTLPFEMQIKVLEWVDRSDMPNISSVNRTFKQLSKDAIPGIIGNMSKELMSKIISTWLSGKNTKQMHELITHIPNNKMPILSDVIIDLWVNNSKGIHFPNGHNPVNYIRSIQHIELDNHSITWRETKMKFLICTSAHHLNLINRMTHKERILIISHDARHRSEHDTFAMYVLILTRLMSPDMFNSLKIKFYIEFEQHKSIMCLDNINKVMQFMHRHSQIIEMHIYYIPKTNTRMIPLTFKGFEIDPLQSWVLVEDDNTISYEVIRYVQVSTLTEEIVIERVSTLTDNNILDIIQLWLISSDDTQAMYFLVKYIPKEHKTFLRPALKDIFQKRMPHVDLNEYMNTITKVTVTNDQVKNDRDIPLNKLNFLLCTVMHTYNANPERTLYLNHWIYTVEKNQDIIPALYVLLLREMTPPGSFSKLHIQFFTNTDCFHLITLNANDEEVVRLMSADPQNIEIKLNIVLSIHLHDNIGIIDTWESPHFEGFEALRHTDVISEGRIKKRIFEYKSLNTPHIQS